MSLPSSSLSLTQIVVGLGVATLIIKKVHDHHKARSRNPRNLPLPPGPKGFPLIGNLLDFPQEVPWEVYNKWSKEYGDLMYLEVLGQRIVILNSLEHAVTLLDKRSGVNSDRPSVPTFDMLEMDYTFGFMKYGPHWRSHRRAVHPHLNAGQVAKYVPIIEEESMLFLRYLLERPQSFIDHIQRLFSHIIMRVAYGVKDFDYNEELSKQAEELLERVSEAGIQGKFLVNIFPVMRHIPSWFPGAGWKRRLEEGAACSRGIGSRPFQDAKKRASEGKLSTTEYPSLAQDMISALPPVDDPTYAYQEQVALGASATTYIGGADTTISSAQAVFIALAMHPEVQKKAQAEIDSVLGSAGRLPKYSDVEHLPYLQAVIREVSRWHNVLPLGFAHLSQEDDVYNGYFIPKGSLLMPNIWAIMHDPTVFKDPLEFRPERYLKDGKLDPDVLDPLKVVFGFGRRICPGRYFSKQALTMMTLSVLSTFDILPPMKNGVRTPPTLKIANGLVVRPAPFECDIVPRSREHAALVS